MEKDRLEFEFHGSTPYPHSSCLRILRRHSPLSFPSLIVGPRMCRPVFQGEIVRIDILTPQVIDKMRVLITTDQFARTEHTVLRSAL